jgi:hypothetical protein
MSAFASGALNTSFDLCRIGFSFLLLDKSPPFPPRGEMLGGLSEIFLSSL